MYCSNEVSAPMVFSFHSLIVWYIYNYGIIYFMVFLICFVCFTLFQCCSPLSLSVTTRLWWVPALRLLATCTLCQLIRRVAPHASSSVDLSQLVSGVECVWLRVWVCGCVWRGSMYECILSIISHTLHILCTLCTYILHTHTTHPHASHTPHIYRWQWRQGHHSWYETMGSVGSGTSWNTPDHLWPRPHSI